MTRDDLMAMTVRQLKAMAKEMGISLGYSAATKEQTIGEILDYPDRVARWEEEHR